MTSHLAELDGCATRLGEGRDSDPEVAYTGVLVLFADGAEVDSLWIHEGHTAEQIAEEKAWMESQESGSLTWAEGWL